ncbi:MAG: hypothetical protein FWB85_11965 [Chitinispirillia bacterium]|nr:hypothetical protein [Chitinispirillia bacterium]
MQIAIDIPPEKADFMVEVLNNFSFVRDVFPVASGDAVSSPKREIGLLDGVGDIIFKDDWEMSDEELLGAG